MDGDFYAILMSVKHYFLVVVISPFLMTNGVGNILMCLLPFVHMRGVCSSVTNNKTYFHPHYYTVPTP